MKALVIALIVVIVTLATAWMYANPEAFTYTGAHRGDVSWYIPRYGQGADGCIWMPWIKNAWRCW